MGAKTRSSEEAGFTMEDILQTRNFSCWFIKVAACLAIALAAISLFGCTSNEDAVPQLKDAQLSTPTIQDDGVLRVGVNTSQSPLAGMGSSKIIGIDVDIAAALADSLGLKLQIVDTGSNPAKALTNGDVDIVFGVDSSDTPSGATLTEKYIPTGVAIFALADSGLSAPDVSSDPKIAAQASSKSAWSVTNTFGSSSLVSSTDLEGAFRSLSDGTVQYVAADAVIGLYTANKAEMDVQIVAITDNATGYCIAVSSSNSALFSAISSGIDELVANGTVSVIENKWLGQGVSLDGITKISKSGSSDSSEGEVTSTESANMSTSNSTASATDANSV